MTEQLLSVGIDIGTSTTQLVLSRLTVENRGNAFSVPRLAITGREIVYRGGIHLTPLLDEWSIDARGVREIVEAEYRASGYEKRQVRTGAVIITGQTARKENARQVLESLSGFAGEFVVATAGPDLESILAARGAGADEYSREHRAKVLHIDIGGGTSNLALYDRGELIQTGCFDVGGRLLQVDGHGAVTHMTPGLQRLFPQLRLGERVTAQSLSPVLRALTAALEQAAGLASPGPELAQFITPETTWTPPEGVRALSFSGGVADCIFHPPSDDFAYGDIGVLLGRAIAASPALGRVELVEGAETIRATVIGAGAHATELSGSTIFYRDVPFPLKDLPILKLTEGEEEPETLAAALRDKLGWFADQGGLTQVAVGLRGRRSPSYDHIHRTAQALVQGLEPLRARGLFPVVVVERDMAKALGQALAPLIGGPLLCLDGIQVETGDYLDVGAPVASGAAVPVVIKTLAFTRRE
jgi:ethanolamine utilization protein EutA